ncbi:hypothetical protein [Longimicrobium terrae]|uniref:DUF2282 domain-containing protein n=1 Tax=Longimicrobium terrae TaxID=1639882 RepID=A0A841GRJ9_9BACT|nr:hypothetical protein [Longimicrobium terrae]MBB4635846.1 hypothetical protein [Longimicrobium terrae]MBB6070242.1 hypothetical protein [Longimicrobium terrae]NNC30746.1 hypothetical protein [Longimicrobium terrae]
MQKNTILRAAALAVTVGAAPLAFSPSQGIVENTACAQVIKNPGFGTCCPQAEATCITPTGNLTWKYYKSDGPC